MFIFVKNTYYVHSKYESYIHHVTCRSIYLHHPPPFLTDEAAMFFRPLELPAGGTYLLRSDGQFRKVALIEKMTLLKVPCGSNTHSMLARWDRLLES